MISIDFAIWYILTISAVIGYMVMPTIFGFNSRYLTNNINKLYGSLLMAFYMGLSELFIYGEYTTHSQLLIWMLVLIIGIVICYYLIIEQIFITEKFITEKSITEKSITEKSITEKSITEKQYLLSMIEHNELAIEMSTKLLEKNNISDEVKKLATGIINDQQIAIGYMKKISK